jgi:hypothetical protein
MGIMDEKWRYPVVRSGSIAHIQDALDRRSSSFLLDSFVFPGNSGGPVILSRRGYGAPANRTHPIDFACVIGLVSAYVPREEIAVSLAALVHHLQQRSRKSLGFLSLSLFLGTIRLCS